MTVAATFGASMGLITGNSGGAIEQLPSAQRVWGKVRLFKEIITLAAQAAGGIAVARARLPFELVSISYLTDTSLGSTTIAMGNSNSASAYHSAQTLTTTGQKVAPTGLAIGAFNAPVTTGYDSVNGGAVTPLAPGQGGAVYEDFILTTAVAALPGAGTLVVFIEVAYE